MIWGSHRHRVGPACDAEVIGRLFAGFRSKEWEYRVYSRAGADMITGVHAVIFTADAERDRAFFRNVLEFPSVDAGGGWLIFALRPRSWRPVLPKRAASTSSGRRTKRDGMYTRRGRKTGDPQSSHFPSAQQPKKPWSDMTTNNAPRSTDERSIRLTLADPANVKVTTWWQTSFVPPDPKSDSLLLLDDRLASGDHAVRVPDLVPPKAAFATVQIDAAIYAFSIATEN
jgi:hypothetical protein